MLQYIFDNPWVRDVFDELIETFPALETNIGPTALIVVSTDFETAIVKVINKNEAQPPV